MNLYTNGCLQYKDKCYKKNGSRKYTATVRRYVFIDLNPEFNLVDIKTVVFIQEKCSFNISVLVNSKIFRYAFTVFHILFCLIFRSTASSVVAQQHHENASDLNIKLAYFSRFPCIVSKTVVECKKRDNTTSLLNFGTLSRIFKDALPLSPKNTNNVAQIAYFPILQETF